MKLRVRGNTLRLRVSRSEVEQMSSRGWVEDATRFSVDSRLVYRLESGAGDAFGAEYGGDGVCVRVPRAALARWLRDDEVSMRAELALGSGETLEVLVEKDFECLNPRAGDDASDAFPNPAKRGP